MSVCEHLSTFVYRYKRVGIVIMSKPVGITSSKSNSKLLRGCPCLRYVITLTENGQQQLALQTYLALKMLLVFKRLFKKFVIGLVKKLQSERALQYPKKERLKEVYYDLQVLQLIFFALRTTSCTHADTVIVSGKALLAPALWIADQYNSYTESTCAVIIHISATVCGTQRRARDVLFIGIGTAVERS